MTTGYWAVKFLFADKERGHGFLGVRCRAVKNEQAEASRSVVQLPRTGDNRRDHSVEEV